MLDRLNDLSIRAKLLGSFSAIALITLAVVGVSVVNIQALDRASVRLHADAAEPLGDLLQMSKQLQRLHLVTHHAMNAETAEERTRHRNEIAMLSEELNAVRTHLDEQISDAEMRAALARWTELRESYVPLRDRAIELAAGGQPEAAAELLQSATTAAIEQLDAVDAMSQSMEARALQLQQDADALAVRVIWATIALGLLSVLVAVGLGLYVTGRVGGPLQKLTRAAERVASGSYEQSVELDSHDEIGALAEAFNSMAGAIRTRVQSLRLTIDASRAIGEAEDVEDGLTVLLRGAKDVTGARYAALSVFNETGELKSFLTLGMSDEVKSGIAHPPVGKGLLGHIHEEGETIRLNDMAKHHASAGFPEGHPPMQSLLAVPIRHQGRALGNIYLSDKIDGEENAFTQDDQVLLEQMAEITGVAITGRMVNEENRKQQEYLARSVERMLDEVNRFADGDLTVHVEPERDDEIGTLFDGFNRAVRDLNGLVSRLDEAVAEASTASEQISRSSEQLAAGSQEQSAQAEEVAAAIEEMTRTVFENAKSVQHTARTAETNGERAREGGQVVEQTISKIREIAGVVQSSAETVERLGRSSEQIGEIVETIDEIADQTNLLALNAAIEAARAGEQGKGFAVVADEVRKLAERTSTATDEIARMIATIQDETAAAVSAMRQGTEQVEEGIALADRTGEALDEIVHSTDDINDMITQVASATEEQSATSEQISRSVEAIATVSNEGAAGITQIAQSAEGLNVLTDDLRVLTRRFRTDAADASSQLPDLTAHDLPSGDGQ